VQAPTTIPQTQLQVLTNIIVAPQQAFIALRERPRWFVAFVVVGVLTLIGGYLSVGATMHAMSVWYPQQLASDPRTSTLAPDRVASLTGAMVGTFRYIWLAAPLTTLAFTAVVALVLLLFSFLFKGDAGFTRTFALAMNGGIIFGLNQLVLGLIIFARGADSFVSPLDLAAAMPSLAWIAPGAPVKVATLLAQIQPFNIWSFVVLALGMSTVARISRAGGYVAAAVPWLIGIGLAVAYAK